LAAEAGLGGFLLELRAVGHRDPRLMAAIERAHRPDFLPAALRELAWRNISLPLDCGQETGTPRQIVRVAAEVALRQPSRLLEIGTGSGWQTALLSGLAGEVVSVERFATLADAAKEALRGSGFRRVEVIAGDGANHAGAGGLFDMVVLNASVVDVPGGLIDALAPRGLLIAPRRYADGVVRLEAMERQGDGWTTRDLGHAVFPPLVAARARAL
jgi:protein-L-isoaspartate(D-aspartate) O-methyltransferase